MMMVVVVVVLVVMVKAVILISHSSTTLLLNYSIFGQQLKRFTRMSSRNGKFFEPPSAQNIEVFIQLGQKEMQIMYLDELLRERGRGGEERRENTTIILESWWVV